MSSLSRSHFCLAHCNYILSDPSPQVGPVVVSIQDQGVGDEKQRVHSRVLIQTKKVIASWNNKTLNDGPGHYVHVRESWPSKRHGSGNQTDAPRPVIGRKAQTLQRLHV